MSSHLTPDPLSELTAKSHDYNPLNSAHKETPNFNRLWLRNGENLKPIQRIGFMVFSLAFLAAGFCFWQASWEFFTDHSSGWLFWALGFGFASAFFFCVGVAGLRNSLRFKKV
jgi:hypothetical protein